MFAKKNGIFLAYDGFTVSVEDIGETAAIFCVGWGNLGGESEQ